MSGTAPSKVGIQRYIVLAFITFILALSTGDRATLSVAGPHMSRDLGLDPIQMGWLFSIFGWSYTFGQAPSGWIVDKFGVKTTLTIGMLAWSLVTVLMGCASWLPYTFAIMLGLRFSLGFVESPVTPSSTRTIASWFPGEQRGMAGAIFNTAQYIAIVLFTPLMGWLDQAFGWQHVFWVMGVLGIVLVVAWKLCFFPPNQHPWISQRELAYIRHGGGLVDADAKVEANRPIERKRIGLEHVWALLRNRMLVGVFISMYCTSALTWFFLSWFPTYLVKGLGFSILQAGFVAALPAICGFLGGVSAGFFSDWILVRSGSLTLARKVPILTGQVPTAAIIGCSFTSSSTVVILLMCVAFFGKAFGALGYTVVADTAPRELVGLTGGLFGTAGAAAGIVTPLVIGYLLASTGTFSAALIFLGLHPLMTLVSYGFIVGKIERSPMPEISRA